MTASVRPAAPWARFDDLKAGTAWRYEATGDIVTAEHPSDVRRALDEVGRRSAAGQWLFGFVTYEAGRVLAGLPAAVDTTDGPAGPPLVWFAVAGPPVSVPVVVPTEEKSYATQPWTVDWDRDVHAAEVAAVRDHIARGEVYQCNLTTRLRSVVTGDTAALYADLACAQRGSHNAYVDTGRWAVVSASPELFVDVGPDDVLMRPMKGTARRGRTLAEDRSQVQRLRRSEKERAENVMIVDLVRNDLGRVAVTGSVEVTALCRAERYETVHQLTSDVVATPRPGTTLTDLFTAVFPSGSVTGAPKRRAMQLIDELEDSPRGVYCGAVGVVAPPDQPFRTRFNVAIRTVQVDLATGAAVYGTGGGVTWDSEAAAEYDELLAKAAVLTTPPAAFDLLETMRHEGNGRIRHLDLHLRRLESSAEYWGFSYDDATVRAALAAHVAAAAPSRVRLILARDGRTSVELGPLPADATTPVTLAVDTARIDAVDPRWQHKTTDRARYTEARARHPHVDDVVLVNGAGELTETTLANLAVRLDGRWWTPPTSVGCLPGVEREAQLQQGILYERTLSIDDLARADGLAVLNGVRGWRPAVLVTERPETPAR